jgi:hypothetical protein
MAPWMAKHYEAYRQEGGQQQDDRLHLDGARTEERGPQERNAEQGNLERLLAIGPTQGIHLHKSDHVEIPWTEESLDGAQERNTIRKSVCTGSGTGRTARERS